jgi:AcrR family transcriptional regulator
MAGLREKQKATRERRIVDAAECLFRQRGYTQTKIEDVASEAGVAVGTVYNYFENKSNLLLALVTEHDKVVSRGINELMKNPPNDLVEGVCGVFFTMTSHSLTRLGRENWRHLVGASITQRHSVLGARFAALNQFLMERIVGMLEALQKNGMLSSDCNVRELGRILFRIEGMLYIDLVSSNAMTYEGYKAQLSDDVRFVLKPHLGP